MSVIKRGGKILAEEIGCLFVHDEINITKEIVAKLIEQLGKRGIRCEQVQRVIRQEDIKDQRNFRLPYVLLLTDYSVTEVSYPKSVFKNGVTTYNGDQWSGRDHPDRRRNPGQGVGTYQEEVEAAVI